MTKVTWCAGVLALSVVNAMAWGDETDLAPGTGVVKNDIRADEEHDPKPPGGQPLTVTDYNVAVDSTGTTYPFIDATPGTQLFLSDDDIQSITWPFDFRVYDSFFTGGVDTIDVNSNGSLHFDAGGPRTGWINCGDAPSTIDGQWVAALGDDLNPSAAGSVWFHVTGTAPNRILTVSWLDVPEFGGTGQIDIQVNLYEGSNTIVTQYHEDVAPVFTFDGVVGINKGDGITGIEVACASAGNLPRPDHDVEYVLITEACCLGDGTCDDLPVKECISAGGTPQGDGTMCATSATACLVAIPTVSEWGLILLGLLLLTAGTIVIRREMGRSFTAHSP